MNAMRLLLGLDIGSTVIKAVVFDLRGRVLASAEQIVPVQRHQPGWVERDANATWSAAAKVLKRVTRGRSSEVVAVGVTGCGNGAVFLDQKLRPVRNGILSSDTRATAFTARLGAQLGQQPYPGQLPALLAWVEAHEPAVARRIAHAVFWKDFVRAKLTGRVCTDFTDVGAAGMLVYPTRTLRTNSRTIPPLEESTTVAGECTSAAASPTGLKEGTPIVTGCIDCEAVAMGSGVHAIGEVSVVAGTWSINQTYLASPPQDSGYFLVNTSVQPDRWLVLEGSPSSASNLDWVHRLFGGKSDIGFLVNAAARTPCSNLIFIPQVPSGNGAFIGLNETHQRDHLVRAVIEGIVFGHRAHLERLPVVDRRRKRVTLAGGGTRSSFFCQLFADVLGCQVDVPQGGQLGALGAAICAGIGIGCWTTVPAAQSAIVPRPRAFLPDGKQLKALDRTYARYRQCLHKLSQ